MPPLHQSLGQGIKTSYKRYSIFNYKDEDILCEPYIVNKDDWLYKIFRKKGEISEKDFPHFLIIFKEINPRISNIDAIEPGNHILIPLKKVNKGDYDQTTPGNVDVPVVEFSAISEDVDITPFLKSHKLKKGETVSDLIDPEFLEKGGKISEEGIKAFQLANPNVKNINIVYEGSDIFLPDPSMRSQKWFQAFSKDDATGQTKTPDGETLQSRLDAMELAQLKKYASLIGGTLLGQGKIYFPGEDGTQKVIDLSAAPIIETRDGTKIVVVAGESVNDELLKSVQAYWKDLKVQLMSESLEELKNQDEIAQEVRSNPVAEYKKVVEEILFQTSYEYVPDAKIPFTLNNIPLEATFGRVLRKEETDLLINFGNVYGAALEVLEKREFEIFSIHAQMTTAELVQQLFAHLGYTTWENPSFFTGEKVEKLTGLYAVKEEEKLFVPLEPMNINSIDYLKKEGVKILTNPNKVP